MQLEEELSSERPNLDGPLPSWNYEQAAQLGKTPIEHVALKSGCWESWSTLHSLRYQTPPSWLILSAVCLDQQCQVCPVFQLRPVHPPPRWSSAPCSSSHSDFGCSSRLWLSSSCCCSDAFQKPDLLFLLRWELLQAWIHLHWWLPGSFASIDLLGCSQDAVSSTVCCQGFLFTARDFRFSLSQGPHWWVGGSLNRCLQGLPRPSYHFDYASCQQIASTAFDLAKHWKFALNSSTERTLHGSEMGIS